MGDTGVVDQAKSSWFQLKFFFPPFLLSKHRKSHHGWVRRFPAFRSHACELFPQIQIAFTALGCSCTVFAHGTAIDIDKGTVDKLLRAPLTNKAVLVINLAQRLGQVAHELLVAFGARISTGLGLASSASNSA